MKIDRLIFENGVTLIRKGSTSWVADPIGVHIDTPSPKINDIATFLNLKPILIIETTDERIERSYLLSTNDNYELIDDCLGHILQPDKITKASNFYHYDNLEYIVGASIYHCKSIALQYSNICNDYYRISKLYGPLDEGGNEKLGLGTISVQHAYYEFDALISCIHRLYDTTRHLLWVKYGSDKKSTPSSFPRALRECRNSIDSDLFSTLSESWDNHGSKVKEYRDCLHHYSPIVFGDTQAVMKKLPNGLWSTSVLIPDNPYKKSRLSFLFIQQEDALFFGWKQLNEAVRILQLINSNQ